MHLPRRRRRAWKHSRKRLDPPAPFGSRWSTTAAIPNAPPAIGGWTPWVLHSRTSIHWEGGETRSPAEASMRAAVCRGAERSVGRGTQDGTRPRRDAFARCLTEKMLTYALGRGVAPAETATVDQIVHRLKQDGYRFSALVLGIVESEPFSHGKPGREIHESTP